jgi:hypothetical protein
VIEEDVFSDEAKAVELRRKSSENIQDQLKYALDAMMDNPNCRTFLAWLIDNSRYFKVSYANNADVYRHEGMRQIGAAVVELLVETRPNALEILKQHGKENFHG